MRILGARDQAEDVVQEAALRCLVSPSIHPDIDSPRAMLRRIVRNLALDQQRRQARQGRTGTDQTDPACPRPGAETALSNRQDLMAALRTLEQLPSRDRRIFLDNRLDARRQTEIARGEGLSPARVHAIIAQTHERLKECLKDNDPL